MQIFAGAMQGIRNPKAHENLSISREDAVKRLVLASLLMDKIDEAISFTNEADGEVYSAVCELPQNYKTVIYLMYYEGYKIKEIANFMKTSEGTIKTWLYRAREALKEKLEGGFENE